MEKKNIFLLLLTGTVLFFTSPSLPAQEKSVNTPFTRGVNMTTWFEAWTPGQGTLNYYDRSDIENVKSLGADVIRLPVHFENLSSGAPDYKINELTLEYLDKVVGWCEELHVYLVIDNHSFNSGTYPSADVVEKSLQKIWPQIASRYKDRSNWILYEILNEPNHIDNGVWNSIQGKVLKTIRTYDTKHTVVVTGADWGSIRALQKVQLYNDQNLIYTFHWYSPFIFTHQGADWANKEEEMLSGIPFPYDKDRMPPVPEGLKGTWMENDLKTKYPVDGTEAGLRNELMVAYNFGKKNNVPVWCGEMGAYNLRSAPEDRSRWYETAGRLLQEMHIPFCVWGYGGGFGLFQKNTYETYPFDLEPAVLRGLGFTVPAGAGTGVSEPRVQVNVPFVLYNDLPEGKTQLTAGDGGSPEKNKTLLACDELPAEGKYCIRWGNCRQYASVNFIFNGPHDFSAALAAHALLSFRIRSKKPGQEFEIRFVNADRTGVKPWRMTYRISAADFTADGMWHTVAIPLSSFKETGAWSDVLQTWYPPEGSFDWSSVYTFQFSAEQSGITGDLYIDDILLTEK
jgi:Endoglucanase